MNRGWKCPTRSLTVNKIGGGYLPKEIAMIKILTVLSVSGFIYSTNAFDGSEFYDDLSGSDQLVAMAHKSQGAAKFPSVSRQSNIDRWTAAAIAVREAGANQPQGQVDVLQSIYNRIESNSYGCRSVNQCVTTEGQFSPTFGAVWAWKSIKDLRTAVIAANANLKRGQDRVTESQVRKADANLQDKNLQRSAAKFVKCRTDFNGESEKPYMEPHNGDITRGSGHNFFGNFYASSGNGRCS